MTSAYFKIIRPINLLLIAAMFGVFKYGFLEQLDIALTLNTLSFVFLVLAVLFISAAGYVINDIQDVAIDTINKPSRVLVRKKISIQAANKYFIALNVLGVGIGFYLANSVGHPGFAAIFIMVSGLLYMYATSLKSKLLIGNLTIAFLVALTPIILILFDIFPAITTDVMDGQVIASGILLHYAFFAFLLNFIREIVKDLQDVNGDKKGGRSTLPIVMGRKWTQKLVFILFVITTLTIVWYMYHFLYAYQAMALYFLLAVLAPLLFVCIKAWTAETPKDLSLLSNMLKVILFLGVLSIFFYPKLLLV